MTLKPVPVFLLAGRSVLSSGASDHIGFLDLFGKETHGAFEQTPKEQSEDERDRDVCRELQQVDPIGAAPGFAHAFPHGVDNEGKGQIAIINQGTVP